MKAPDLYELTKMEEAGYVRCTQHPTLPLFIWNYTEACTYEAAWNETTLQCRGLITDVDGTIVARPFIKFFNLGEPMCPVRDATRERGFVQVEEKMDGSLGIIYPTPDGPAVATRGSFTSEQALHATKLLRLKYRRWAPPEGITVLVEIIYPENRVVLDYGDLDDLVYLTAIDNETGADVRDDHVLWPGSMREQFEVSISDLLSEIAAPQYGDNREGYVLVWPRSDGPAVRVKIKYAEYVALHRIVTGLSTRVIHEALMAGTWDDFQVAVPDEWKAAAIECATALMDAAAEVRTAARLAKSLAEHLPTRKDQAAFLLSEHADVASLAFALLDGKEIDQAIWRRVAPAWKMLGRAQASDAD